jgi:hypothetical protein
MITDWCIECCGSSRIRGTAIAGVKHYSRMHCHHMMVIVSIVM